MTPTTPNNNRDGLWFCITVLIMCICIAVSGRCHAAESAKLDTVLCKPECIKTIVVDEKTSAKGNKTIKYTAIYVDSRAGIMEAIYMSKSTYEYIQQCKEYGLEPTLGIKLKNGEINAIVRIRKKLVK